MAKDYRRAPASRLGISAAMPAAAYEHRIKPARTRVKVKAIKPESTKPRAHRVGRSKR